MMLKWFKAHTKQIFAFLGCFVCLMGLMTIFVSAESPTTVYPNYPTYTDRRYAFYTINGVSSKVPITNFAIQYRFSDGSRFQTSLSNINIAYTGSTTSAITIAPSSADYGTLRFRHLADETINEQSCLRIQEQRVNGTYPLSQVTIFTTDSFAVAPTYDESTQSRQDRLILSYGIANTGGYRVQYEFHYVGNTNRFGSSFTYTDSQQLDLTYDMIVDNSTGGSNSVPIIIDYLIISVTTGALSTNERIAIPYQYGVEMNVLRNNNEIVYQNTLNDISQDFNLNAIITAVGGFFDAPIFGGLFSIGALMVALLSVLLAIAIINALKG